MTSDKDQNGQETLQEETLAGDDVAQSEEWQSDLPPDDDFHDQSVEDDLIEEAAAEGAYEEAPAQDTNKRGKGVLFGALFVGVAVMGGLAYLQFGGGTNETANTMLPAAAVMSVKDIKTSGAPTKSGDVAGFEEGVNKAGEKIDADKMFEEMRRNGMADKVPGMGDADPAMGRPIATTSTDVLSSTAKESVPAVKEVPAAPAPVATAPVEMPPPAAVPAKKVEAVEAPAPAKFDLTQPPPLPASLTAPETKEAATISAKKEAETEARLKALSAQVDTLKKSLDESTQRNTDLLARLEEAQKKAATATAPVPQAATTPPKAKTAAKGVAKPTPAPSTPAPAVKDQTKQLVSVSDDQSVWVDPSVMLKPSEPPKPETAAPVEPEKPIAAQPTEEAKPAAAPKKASPTPKKTTAKQTKSTSKWVLRAATPDAAWVSAGPESEDLRRVNVGEKLPGIGKIKEIRQKGDDWEVVGTTGTLK